MSELLLTLALLACPVGMGAMMWFIMRGNKSHEQSSQGDSSQDVELASLRAELDQLRAEQREAERRRAEQG